MFLQIGPKISKRAYITTRCRLLVGKTTADALGTLFLNGKGDQSKYSAADLKYDLNTGTLTLEGTPNDGLSKTKSRTTSSLSPTEGEPVSKKLKKADVSKQLTVGQPVQAEWGGKWWPVKISAINEGKDGTLYEVSVKTSSWEVVIDEIKLLDGSAAPPQLQQTEKAAGKRKGREASTKKKASSSRAASFTAIATPVATEWLLKKSSGPSNCGANRGMSDTDRERMTDTATLSSHNSYDEAVAAAIAARGRECSFEGWAEEFYQASYQADGERAGARAGATADPPFFSGDGENEDDDDWVTIFLVSPTTQNEAATKATKALNLAMKVPAKKPFTVAFGEVAARFAPLKDNGIFFRNPTDIQGAKVLAMSAYPSPSGGQPGYDFLDNVRRDSDRNYLMRSFCLEGSIVSGASFTTVKKPNAMSRVMSWLTPTNLEEHVDDESIVDGYHAGLFHPNPKNSRFDILLSVDSLLAECSPATRCLFLDCFTAKGGGCECAGFTATAVAEAIAATDGQLQCFAMSESCISNADVAALSKCVDLRGFMVSHNSHSQTDPPTDEAMAQLLRKTGASLKWLWCHALPFGNASWNALADGACPHLEFLWVSQ
jgi:hypothetical protein